MDTIKALLLRAAIRNWGIMVVFRDESIIIIISQVEQISKALFITSELRFSPKRTTRGLN